MAAYDSSALIKMQSVECIYGVNDILKDAKFLQMELKVRWKNRYSQRVKIRFEGPEAMLYGLEIRDLDKMICLFRVTDVLKEFYLSVRVRGTPLDKGRKM